MKNHLLEQSKFIFSQKPFFFMIQIIVWISALCIGLSLGLIGGGGSTLTVPVMTYLVGLDPKTATAYSLFIVGISALFGALKKYQSKDVNIRTGLFFAIPSMFAVYLTRLYLVPLLSPLFIMLFFAFIMFLASYSMIKGRKKEDYSEDEAISPNYIFIVILSLSIGLIAGTVGAGGGFLIIPSLVFFLKMPMKKAIGTSLFVISIQSLFGFYGDIRNESTIIDWELLLPFSGVAVLGILLGSYLVKYISSKNLKSGFGYFILLMAVFILSKELL